MTRLKLFATALVAVIIVSCGGAPKPEARMASSEGAIRGAQEAGADKVPAATLHLKLAQEQRDQALQMIKDGENHRASMLLARAEADAELAVALARAANAQADAEKAQETVQDLKQKANQMSAKLWTVIPIVTLIACGAHAPPKELVDARAAYAHAEAGAAAKLVPAELHVARESLDVAERAFNDKPDSQDTVDNSYIALRKAERAEALGNAAAAEGDRVSAERTASKTERAMLENTEGRLKQTQTQLQRERGELAKQKELTEAERAARIEAEKKAKDAMEALSKSLAVKADTRGTVITLSGGVVFATNQATILPGAQAQLDQVARRSRRKPSTTSASRAIPTTREPTRSTTSYRRDVQTRCATT